MRNALHLEPLKAFVEVDFGGKGIDIFQQLGVLLRLMPSAPAALVVPAHPRLEAGRPDGRFGSVDALYTALSNHCPWKIAGSKQP